MHPLERYHRRNRPADDTKPAICCRCGLDLKARVPKDAEQVTCYACDTNMPFAERKRRREQRGRRLPAL
jgi:hypothetical protein